MEKGGNKTVGKRLCTAQKKKKDIKFSKNLFLDGRIPTNFFSFFFWSVFSAINMC